MGFQLIQFPKANIFQLEEKVLSIKFLRIQALTSMGRVSS